MNNKMLSFVILSILIAGNCNAIPQVAAEYYGWVIIDGKYAPQGTKVEIIDNNGIKCGESVVRENGMYGLLSCEGDDLGTIEDEGPVENEGLIFLVNQTQIHTKESLKWRPGSFREVNLIVGSVYEARALVEKPGFPVSNIRLYVLLLVLLLSFILMVFVGTKIYSRIKELKNRVEVLTVET